MSPLPADALALAAVVYMLGLRHGMDPDHLATIDGITRGNALSRPRLSRWSGFLFSLGHGIVVIMVTVLVGTTAGRWITPEWLDAVGAWISIAFLIVLGISNIHNVFTALPGAVVGTVGLKSRWLGSLSHVQHPLLIAGIGALFAISFDTFSQVALFSLTASSMKGLLFCVILGVAFMLGMMTTDGINGLWISRLIHRADRRAAICSRVMGLTLGTLSLLVGLCGMYSQLFADTATFLQGSELAWGCGLIVVVAVSFLAAMRLSSPQRAETAK